jgi:hypothetical protein
MPRKLESGGTYQYCLKSDRENHPEQTFDLLILSSREDDRLRELSNAWRQATDNATKATLMTEMLTLAVKGWRNMQREFSIGALEELLTKPEQWELLADVTLEAAMSPDERKKFELRQQSETG